MMTTTKRLVALTAAGSPLPRAFARLVEGLRQAGTEVLPLPIPREEPGGRSEQPPRLSDLKAGLQSLAQSVSATLRGERAESGQQTWLLERLRAIEGAVDGVVTLDPLVAAMVFPALDEVWPQAVRIGVDGDFHVDPEWDAVPFDDLVTPDPSLGREARAVREGAGRLRTGGVLVGGPDTAPRRLDDALPQVVVSFARLPTSDVDALLFQLSLAHPDRFSLLFLPSGRSGVDELVRARAGGYGLQGKRPKPGADVEPWIRGAALLMGHPAPQEAAVAVAAGVPQLLFAPDERLDPGDGFLIKHGLAFHVPSPIAVAVQCEALLPGGADRDRALRSLADCAPQGVDGIAEAVGEAVAAGRPRRDERRPAPEEHGADGELEEIGGEQAAEAGSRTMGDRVRRAYLREIILQHKEAGRQLLRVRSGLDTWRRRARLAQSAGDQVLAERARVKVDGLERLAVRLEEQDRRLTELRDAFASRRPLLPEERASATRFMSVEAAATLDQLEAREADEFSRLEIDDALAQLKRRAGPS